MADLSLTVKLEMMIFVVKQFYYSSQSMYVQLDICTHHTCTVKTQLFIKDFFFIFFSYDFYAVAGDVVC